MTPKILLRAVLEDKSPLSIYLESNPGNPLEYSEFKSGSRSREILEQVESLLREFYERNKSNEK